MKTKKILSMFLFGALMGAALVSCSSDDDNNDSTPTIVGTWTEVNGDDRYTFYQDGTGMKYELEDGKWEQDDTDKFKYVYNESKKTVDITRYNKGVQKKSTINATDVNITAKTMSWKRNGNTAQ